MEILGRRITLKDIGRIAAATAVSLAPLACTLGPKPELKIQVSCSDEPAYGLRAMGLHGRLNLKASNLDRIRTTITGGSWLFMAKPEANQNMLPVGWAADSNSFSTYIDGFINTISDRGPMIRRFELLPGDRLDFSIRRGPYMENVMPAEVEAATQELLGASVRVECAQNPQ